MDQNVKALYDGDESKENMFGKETELKLTLKWNYDDNYREELIECISVTISKYTRSKRIQRAVFILNYI